MPLPWRMAVPEALCQDFAVTEKEKVEADRPGAAPGQSAELPERWSSTIMMPGVTGR